MLDLGYFYDEGVGTRQDKIKAMFWYKRAYRRGSSAAASNIAILYRERNQARQVFHWFRRAAALGDGDAQVDLAKLFLDGKGVRRSALKAKAALLAALASDLITEAAREEAAVLLSEIEDGL
jgi:TPR repeat protein